MGLPRLHAICRTINFWQRPYPADCYKIMSNYKNEIEISLGRLDESANANTAWLQFELNAAAAFDLQAFLLAQLKTRHFHLPW